MDAPAAESRTFLHRVLRWLAILALGYGLLQVVTLTLFAATQDFPFDRYWMRDRRAALALSLVHIASVVLLLAGAWGLLRWKSWARVGLFVWAALVILLGLVRAIGSTAYFIRETTAMTQPSFQGNIGFLIWNSFHFWVENCALPIVFIVVLHQPEVAKLWARRRSPGGFDVIPMASAVVPRAGSDSTRD